MWAPSLSVDRKMPEAEELAKNSQKTPQMRSAQTLARLGYYEKIIKYIVTNCLVFLIILL